MIYLLFFMCVAFNVLAFEGPGLKKAHEVKKEPVTMVDRHVLNANDYKQDASILIAGVRVTPKFEVSDPQPISAEQVRVEYLPQANPMADVKVSATIESDTEAPSNYPL